MWSCDFFTRHSQDSRTQVERGAPVEFLQDSRARVGFLTCLIPECCIPVLPAESCSCVLGTCLECGMCLGEHGSDLDQRYNNRAEGLYPDRISFPTVVSVFCFKIRPNKPVK